MSIVQYASALVLGLSLMGCSRRMEAEPSSTNARLLSVGASIPNLTGTDQHGGEHHLKDSDGHPLLVYFYPKDGTPGCTKEACAFRDVWKQFEQRGVALFGVSRDDRASHEQFAHQHQIPFPLIADNAGTWASAFGVPSNGGRYARVSFLFDSKGRLVHVYPNVDPGVHASQVLGDVPSG